MGNLQRQPMVEETIEFEPPKVSSLQHSWVNNPNPAPQTSEAHGLKQMFQCIRLQKWPHLFKNLRPQSVGLRQDFLLLFLLLPRDFRQLVVNPVDGTEREGGIWMSFADLGQTLGAYEERWFSRGEKRRLIGEKHIEKPGSADKAASAFSQVEFIC